MMSSVFSNGPFINRFACRISDCRDDNSFRLVAEARSLEQSGRDIAYLMLGEPDFDTPRNIIDKAKWALDNHYTHYTHSAGIPELRDRYAEYVNRQYGVGFVDGKNIVIQPGGSMICFLACAALIDPGDEAIILDPTFPVYEQSMKMFGGIVRRLPLDEKSGWRFDHDMFASMVSSKTKIVFLNSPQNPTGGILEADDFKFVAGFARQFGFYVFSDEIYNRFVYDREHSGILDIPDFLEHTILLDGHSKTYAMTGWRLAFSVTSPALAEKFTDLMTLINCNTASFTQVAGDEALHGDQTESQKMIAEFRARRDIIYEGLKSIDGVSLSKPLGAFYAFLNVKKFSKYKGKTSRQLQSILLHKYGVAVLPGTIFGPAGEGYIRLSYAADRETIKSGLDRLKTAFSELG